MPTEAVPASLSSNCAYSISGNRDSSSPNHQVLGVPPRQANSHSASVGRRYCLPSGFRQPTTECLSIIPTHIHDRMIIGLLDSWASPVVFMVVQLKSGLKTRTSLQRHGTARPSLHIVTCSKASRAALGESAPRRVRGYLSEAPIANSPGGIRRSFMPIEFVSSRGSFKCSAHAS